jgi:hypothetical protein
MRVERHPERQEYIVAHFNKYETDAFLDSCRERMLGKLMIGEEPSEFDADVLDNIEGGSPMSLTCPVDKLEPHEVGLALYAKRTLEQVALITGVPEEKVKPPFRDVERGIADLAIQRCNNGIQAMTMSVELEGARMAFESDLHEQVEMFLAVESLSKGFTNLDEQAA